MKFDDLLRQLNGLGKFQFRLILLVVIPRATLPFHFLLNNFTGFIPSHHCNISGLDDGGVFGNLSDEQRLTISVPVQDDGTPSSCLMFTEPQYHLLMNSSNTTGLPVVCQNGWVFDTSVVKSTVATEWNLVCERRRLNRATTTIFFGGVMLGAAVLGTLSDRLGRKPALLVSYVTTVVFGLASALSSNFPMFAVMRFFTGFGSSGLIMITMVLCLEWTDHRHRWTVAIFLGLDWCLNTMTFAAVAYFVTEWRYLTAVGNIPVLLAIISWWWLPESARWLLSHGKVNRTYFYLRKCAQVNCREQFLDHLNPETLSKVIVVENENKKYSALDLVRTPRMRRTAMLTGIAWFGMSCCYYGISFNVSGFGVNMYLTQFIHGAIELPAKFLVFFTLNKVGRRLSQGGAIFVSGLCLLLTLFIPLDKGAYVTAVAALGKMFAQAAFTVAFLYVTELYPTVMRQNGMGLCNFMARLGAGLSPLIYFLEDVWVGLPNVVFCVSALTAGLSTCLLKETANTHLPETIEDVEQSRTWQTETANRDKLTG
ncbi:solute carrier family 22 member 7-like [Syngnathus acus]|uniref:solute carrier family 22 member 7-like n=1 Tax=Syngnathus acus TaxID=161584 RepID=UPI001886047C|nr:solute carrier family 22 member 7-like [Syngnathus acus]